MAEGKDVRNVYIPINDRFEVSSTKHCWILRDISQNYHENGKPRDSIYQTYHPTLKHVAEVIADRCAHGAKDIEELLDTYNRFILKMERLLIQESKIRS